MRPGLLEDLEWLGNLHFSMLGLRIRARTELVLPPFLGSTLRGAFGTALKRVVCVLPEGRCDSCPLCKGCPYVKLFEPPNSLEWMDTSRLPPPFVLRPPSHVGRPLPAGAELRFQCVLVGWALDYLPHFLAAWQTVGTELGIGGGRAQGLGRFELVEVVDGLNPGTPVFAHGCMLRPPDTRTAADCSAGREREVVLRAVLKTPVRLRSEGRLLGRGSADGFTPRKLLEAAYRRLYTLAACYGTDQLGPMEVPAFPDVPPLYASLRWQEWDRYSHRQRTHMRLGGLVGEIVLGPEYRPWFPLLRAASVLHVGKATTFGFGQLDCEGLTPPASRAQREREEASASGR